jgi:small-conductance mechanosensitive channel
MSVEELLAILSAPAVRAIAAFLVVVVCGWAAASMIGRGKGAPADRRRVRKALRTPLRIASLALGLAAAAAMLGSDSEVRPDLAMLARMGVVLAIGLAFTRLGELWLVSRIAKLDIGAEDNLMARQSATRLGILRRVWAVFFTVLTVIAALTVAPQFRSLGLSLFASAGVAGLVIGIAAGPVLTNLFAGIQVAITQPIRIEDAVVVEGEWGWIEEIGLFHVVIRIWDWRRLVVPLSYFVNTPFQNWTRTTAAIIGSVSWKLDYTAPVAEIRSEVERLIREHPLWDGQVVVLQVIDATDRTIELRALMSAKTSPQAWDLRCAVRERIITWLQENHPACLPKLRIEETPGLADQPHAKEPPPEAIVRDPSLREGPRDES